MSVIVDLGHFKPEPKSFISLEMTNSDNFLMFLATTTVIYFLFRVKNEDKVKF